MISRFFFLLLCGIISAHLGDAQKLPKVKKLNMKVHINITGDTLVMKFHRPYQSIKLEGFILGYGSNYFTNQYIQWPDNGKSYITDVEAETRYLIAVKPNDNPKKSCKEKNSSQKPLQLVIGSLTPTSVFLSWGILINPQVDWSALNKCPNDRFYTVRYREKNKDWLFQLCPTTETVIDNLKPNTMYEFGVKDNSDEGIWSKPQNHKTNLKGKENGNIENSYKIPKATLQYASEDTKTLIPVYVVKQGFQNVTKSTPAPPPTARSPVLKKETKKPHLRTTTRTPTPKPVSKVTESPPITKPPGKAVDEDPKAALTSRPIVESFTPESSAGTLEWVRATMVTHPYVQVTNIPTEPSVSHGQSTPLVFVRDYNGAPRESTDIPTKESLPTLDPPRAKTAHPVTSQHLPSGITVKRQQSSTQVPKETASFHPKPFPSTEAPHMEPDSTQPDSEIHTSEAPHTYEPDKITLASDDKTVVQKLTSTSKPETTTVYRTTSMSFKSNTPATSQRTQSTEALKRTGVSPAHPKIPLPEETYPTAVLKDMQPTKLVEETTTIMVPTETQKMSPKKIHITESPSPPADPKTSHLVPPDVLGFDIFEHPVLPLVPNKTEKVIPLKSDKTAPPATAVPKAMQTKGMPINLIRIHIFEDPTVPSAKIETQTTSPPTPKTTSKSTHWVPINVIRLHIFEDPDVPKVPNTTIAPLQPTTTKSPESPHSKPVPTQKISQRISKKPKPTPHAKPASTEAPKDTIKPKIQHVTLATTLAPYRLQTQRPKASVRPRTRFAQNGTTQGVGDFNYVPGTLPGGRVFDSTKLLGGSTNISMTPNNTGKRTFSVSSTPLPPVRPTNIRRRIQPGNITGSSPPFQPVRPTSIRRRPQPTNVTGRPGHAGDILIPRAPSTARPNHTTISIKTPKKQPTLPAPEEDLVETTVFSPSPKSDIDALGKSRYVAPHVMYMSKDEKIPCSITESMKYFPVEEGSNQEIINAPQNPPSNLTVVTVEGCPSFVILDWDQPDNDTVTEYEVISKENGAPPGKDQSILVTNQTHSTVENLKPDTSYEFHVIPKNPLGEGPVSATVEFNTESADPRVSEPVSGGKDAIWTEIKFKSDSYSECRGKQFVKRTWYKKFVGIQLCNSLRYKIYLSDTLSGKFYNIGDQSGYGEDHCQFVDSFLDGRTGQQLLPEYLVPRQGFYRSVRQQPVDFGNIGGQTHISYVHWYECGIAIPGKW
ncbi:target of Nesh-SH3 isoform X30 [Mixophyes fleayi]|uniref:target of Nesh-SH3 isoform X30 n=1 Tax=Mixophyes fleayi TaxID=3061075 RepID=UPI003F4DD298